jgi:hypothetical protein
VLHNERGAKYTKNSGNMEQIILLNDRRKVEEIAKVKRVTPRAVYMALRYQRNSTLCRALRVMAIENGGFYYKKVTDRKEMKL